MTDDDPDARAQRARRRSSRSVRRTTLDDDGHAELCAATSPEQRIAMMRDLAAEAWRVAGGPTPTCDRANAPIRRTTRADA